MFRWGEFGKSECRTGESREEKRIDKRAREGMTSRHAAACKTLQVFFLTVLFYLLATGSGIFF